MTFSRSQCIDNFEYAGVFGQTEKLKHRLKFIDSLKEIIMSTAVEKLSSIPLR